MLKAGQNAPDWELQGLDGSAHQLSAHPTPLTLAIFFKTTCPTCRYAWTYYERLHQAYADSGLRVLGISQHDAQRSGEYKKELNATFPILLDTEFSVSRAYDPPFVPTGFLIDRKNNIVETFESWNSRGMNEFSGRVGERLQVEGKKIVLPEDHATASKHG